MWCPLSIPGKPSWHPELCGMGFMLVLIIHQRTSKRRRMFLKPSGHRTLPVIFLWWYLVLPTKLRLWQRTETTSSSLVQLRFHINKLKCIFTVCRVNLPAFRRRLWHLLFRDLPVIVSIKENPPLLGLVWGSGPGFVSRDYSLWARASQLKVWGLSWTFDEVFTGPL